MKESEFDVENCDIVRNPSLKKSAFSYFLRILYFTKSLWVLP